MVPTTDENTAVAYLRVSTGRQAESGLGLEAQKAAVVEMATKLGITILSFHTDAGVSGRAPMDKRPALMAAMASSIRNRVGFFLVAKMDRLSRDTLTALTVEKALLKSGVSIKSANGEGTASDDAGDVLLRRILQAVSAHEVALCSSRTKAALKAKKERGERIGRPPVGFTIDAEGKMAPTPELVDVIRACRMRSEGKKLREVEAAMGWKPTKTLRVTKRWGGRMDELLGFLKDLDE
jgi:DNA invertase Pin-like site-specific DNA recombinase